MVLSKRLTMVVDQVPKTETLADVGCDHAYISISMIQRGTVKKAIAMDVNRGPLQRAADNIEQYGYTDQITTRLSNGLEHLIPGEADCIVIAGMGGNLMIQILTEGSECVEKAKDIILQPQSEISSVRHYLHKIGYQIIEEDMCLEDGKYYTVLHAVNQSGVLPEEYPHEYEYRYGKELLDHVHPVLVEYLNKEIKKYTQIKYCLERNKTKNTKERLPAFLTEMTELKEALTCLQQKGGNIRMDLVRVTIHGVCEIYEKGTSFEEIKMKYQKDYPYEIILVRANGKLRELFKTVQEDCVLEFVTLQDNDGHKTYTRGMILLMLRAFDLVIDQKYRWQIRVEHSIGSGLFCEFIADTKDDLALTLDKVKNEMKRLIKEDIPFFKSTIGTTEAAQLFHEYEMFDKEKLFRFRRVSKTNIYTFDGYQDYFYGYMPPSAGMLKEFDLFLYENGFILLLPEKSEPDQLKKFVPRVQLFATLQESNQWGKTMGIDTVGALNEQITKGEINDIIMIQEALLEKKIGAIADQIHATGNRKFIMIAGPSSSGKTTFARRLSIQLRILGYKPHAIGIDDYFVNREFTPKHPDGEYNYETLEAIDVEQFNKDMNDLLEGKNVELPSYNFKLGKREYKGNVKTLGPDDILIIEGIHGLNDKLSHTLPKESKFKIYISALTQLSIDEHNRISTTDGRLIRRIVRDARTRGTGARETIAMWPSVRKGEEENIFPFQEEADCMFNSAMIYELPILKQYAEPLLFGIDPDVPEYSEAKRLLKFLDYILGVSSESVPQNSILREFIGGGYFKL